MDTIPGYAQMNPYKVCFTFFGLIYAVIAMLGLMVAVGVTIVGIAGILWCSAGWFITHKYL